MSREEINPFKLTKAELDSLDPNYKKPKKKARKSRSSGLNLSDEEENHGLHRNEANKQTRLHYMHTKSTRLKKRTMENVYDLYSDLDSMSGGCSEDDEANNDLEDDRGRVKEAAITSNEDDPTFELANVRRFIIGSEPLSKFIANSRQMFLLKYSLSVKRDEKKRLETEMREEELSIQKTESELRLAEQAFDQFLQENDRKAVGAMKSAEQETRLRMEKATALKQVDNRIIALKRDINKLKDVLAEYGTYEGFLHSMSPEAWRQLSDDTHSDFTSLKEFIMSPRSVTREPSATTTTTSRRSVSKWKITAQASAASTASIMSTEELRKIEEQQELERKKKLEKEAAVAKVMTQTLNMSTEEFEKAKGAVKLYFQHPQQLLSIFTDLEDENLKLIQECREEEGNLEKIKTSVRETRSRLNHQAANFELEIRKVEEKISNEKAAEAELIKLQEERANVEETAAEAKRAEDKILRELGKQVRLVYVDCIEPLDQEVSTMDLLKRIELRMEVLTQELERLPIEKVKIAQRTCERERRQREHEAKMERQRQIEADRNKKALDRALAPPFVKPCLRGMEPTQTSFVSYRDRMSKKRGRNSLKGDLKSDDLNSTSNSSDDY